MQIVNILEAKTQLSRLVERVESGAEPEIIIARNGRPAARLVPLARRPTAQRIGVAAGRFQVPDSIDGSNALIEKLFGGDAPQ
jgi:prevent-host-death family protein